MFSYLAQLCKVLLLSLVTQQCTCNDINSLDGNRIYYTCLGQLCHFFETLLLTLFCICMYYYVFCILCLVNVNKTISINLKIDIFNQNTIFIIVVHEWT